MLPYIVGPLGFEPRYMHTPSIQCTALPFAYSPIKVREHLYCPKHSLEIIVHFSHENRPVIYFNLLLVVRLNHWSTPLYKVIKISSGGGN